MLEVMQQKGTLIYYKVIVSQRSNMSCCSEYLLHLLHLLHRQLYSSVVTAHILKIGSDTKSHKLLSPGLQAPPHLHRFVIRSQSSSMPSSLPQNAPSIFPSQHISIHTVITLICSLATSPSLVSNTLQSLNSFS